MDQSPSMSNPNEKFKVRLSQPEQADPGPGTEESPAGEFRMTELDLLYQQALDAMEEVESDLNRTSEILLDNPDESQEAENSSQRDGEQEESGPEKIILNPTRKSDSGVTPEMVIEAMLFVGGQSLTTKKLCTILGGNSDPDSVQAVIDGLNQMYENQNRPYEIQFGEGGYRLVLKGEFERVRNKVFGMGPKEIKLSQEALEVLSLIAYEQPVTNKQIDKLTKRSCNGTLRQLLRRELIEMDRDEKDRKIVSYQTTDRFLKLFGITELGELPQSEKIDYK